MGRHRLLLIACIWLFVAIAQSTRATPPHDLEAADYGFQPGPTAVTTSAYDNRRTGWNHRETTLTPAALRRGGFGLLQTVNLGHAMFAPPLVMPNVSIAGDPAAGTHDVVYVTTSSNDVLAINPENGTVLLQRNLGGVPATTCGPGSHPGSWAPTSGGSAIDANAGTLLVMVRTAIDGVTAFQLHALDLATLADRVPPQTVAASHTLTDGSTLPFNATLQLQRPALLLSRGVVYAGFGAACEGAGQNNNARGWVLGWKADTLAPLQTRRGTSGQFVVLTDADADVTGNFYLSSIWMSGAGLAADQHGSIYFVTGNSSASGRGYDGVNNIPETLVRLSASTAKRESQFTPYNVSQLDMADEDFGSGGVTLLPEDGHQPPLAVAAGKSGIMYLLNRDALGGYTPGGPDNVLAQVAIGPCWCAESVFSTRAGKFVVSSGGDKVMLWQVTQAASPSLQLMASSAPFPKSRQPGIFTSVSSDRFRDPVIWTVGQPQGSGADVTLYAFDASPPPAGSPLTQLVSVPAGQWTNGLHETIRPVVANGRVYVATSRALLVFGFGATFKP